MSGVIVNIATGVPKYRHEQKDIVSFMIDAHGGSDIVSRQLNILYKRSGISTRYSTLPDFDMGKKSVFFNGKAYPNLSERLKHYKAEAISLAGDVAKESMGEHCTAEDITHIVTVSCTGLFTPGLEMELIKYLGLKRNVQRHPINFIGCYAAIPALNLANMICCQDKKAKVLVVSVELCTLHFQNENIKDNYTANAIFADGAAACLIAGEESGLKGDIKIGSHYSEVHSEGEKDMAWIPAETGFLMKLSSYVPQLIHNDIQEYVRTALQKAGVNNEEVRWAFHPGGIQILQRIEKVLGLDDDMLAPSYKVLDNYGNMSSPTILFVLKEILDGQGKDKNIFCSAFGPGLTFESIIIHHV